MSFTFHTYQTVPANVVKKIGQEIFREYVKNLHLDNDMSKYIQVVFQAAIEKVAAFATPSVDGYTLTPGQTAVIASNLKDGAVVSAIREFRSATGAGLRDAKTFIDQFGSGNEACRSFMTAFGL